MRNFIILAVAISLSASIVCGMAIADMERLDALNGTQAYLLIDAKSASSYNEIMFFHMVSMGEPYNVTLVFPIGGIPKNLTASQMTADEFLDNFSILAAEDRIKAQKFSSFVNKTRNKIKAASSEVFTISNGIIATIYFRMVRDEDTAVQEQDPVPDSDLEEGSLEIYGINFTDTLEEFINETNITGAGKVKELVTKYNDSPVVVLDLKVHNSSVNGTLVNITFERTNGFFYPASIMDSFNYAEKKYFIKIPPTLHIGPNSSKVNATGTYKSQRWYRFASTDEDLRGAVVEAGLGKRFGDVVRMIKLGLYKASGFLVFLFYLIVIAIPYYIYTRRVGEYLTLGEVGLLIVLMLTGGMLLTSIVMAFKKKIFALTVFLLWLALFGLMLLFTLLF